jgi:hypothetical protein
MKELYSFPITREIEKTIPYVSKNKKGEMVESTKVVKSQITNRVVFQKPNFSDIENAEFFYGQKYNELINAGFLTKAMLNKKLGDIGGTSSKLMEESVNKAFVDNLESAKIIQFYEGRDDLDEEQTIKLKEARELFVSSLKNIENFENSFRTQYQQTAETKAEQKIIEWFLFNFSYYEEELSNGSKEIFPLFLGDDYEEKREHYLRLCEDAEDISDKALLKNKAIFDKSFMHLVKVVNIWYNKVGKDQEEIDKKIKELFPDE